MIIRVVIFLVLNFAALGIGSLFTGQGVPSDWYQGLNKAPWTPPGWVFGAAWTTIMICFAIYMAYLWPQIANKKMLLALFLIQWILNVSWNPLFFHFKLPSLGLLVILSLTLVVGYFLFRHLTTIRWISVLIVPYFLWLLIATSLNAYIVLNN